MKRGAATTIVFALLALAPCAGASGGPAGSQAVVAARLARAIMAGGSLGPAFAAAEEALARGGVATVNGRRVVRGAFAPAAPWSDQALEVLDLAVGARAGPGTAQLTLGTFAQDLQRAGFQVDGAGWVKILRSWVGIARKQPRSPMSFTPLFLDAMARLRQPSIDLGGRYSADSVHLSLLESELLSAAVVRSLGTPPVGRAPAPNAPQAPARTSASDPCSTSLNLIVERDPNSLGAKLLKELIKEEMYQALETESLTKQQLKDLIFAAQLLSQVQRLMTFYQSVFFHVDLVPGVPNPLMMPVAGPVTEGFVAHAGLTSAAEQEYQQVVNSLGGYGQPIVEAINSCAKALGLPTLTFATDVAKKLAAFHVLWSFTRAPDFAVVDLGNSKPPLGPPFFKQSLLTASPTLAYGVFAIDVQTQSDYPNPPPPTLYVLKNFTVTASAKLDMSEMPNPKLLLDMIESLAKDDEEALKALTKATIKALTEIVLEMTKSLATPIDSSDLTLQYWACRLFGHAGDARAGSGAVGSVCGYGPYSGTFSGTEDHVGPDGGLTEQWHGTVDFASPPTPGADVYSISSGSVTWSVSGSWPAPFGGVCTASGGGTQPAPEDLTGQITLDPSLSLYQLAISSTQAAQFPLKITGPATCNPNVPGGPIFMETGPQSVPNGDFTNPKGIGFAPRTHFQWSLTSQ